jgi:hypothetical protein
MKKNIPFGSVIRKKFIPDPDPGFVGGGGKKAPDPGSGSATLLLHKHLYSLVAI